MFMKSNNCSNPNQEFKNSSFSQQDLKSQENFNTSDSSGGGGTIVCK